MLVPEVDVQRLTQMADPLYGMRRVTHSGFGDGEPTVYSWDGDVDLLEPVTSQSDGPHPTGLQRQFPKGYTPVPLTVPG